MRDKEGKSRAFAKALRRRLTHAETILWAELRRDRIGHHFRRQHPIGPFIADFACVREKLVIEVDGITHWSDEDTAKDRARDAFMKAQGWRVLRVTNDDVYKQLNVVIELIAAALPPPPPSAVPLPRLRGRKSDGGGLR